MSGGKETPRQKMIGMMYLVLLAMLAMNVSKSVLDAFIIINEGLEVTNENFSSKNDVIYGQFESARANDPAKVDKYFKNAMKARDLSNELNAHIEELKERIILFTDYGNDESLVTDDSLYQLRWVNGKDNYDAPTSMLLGAEPTSPKEGEWTAMELKSKINNFKDEMKYLIENEVERNALELGLDTDKEYNEGDMTVKWEVANFYHLPLAAVITNLTKIQSDVRNTEADIIKLLYKNIDAGDFKFDTLAAKVIPRSTYVIQGDSFIAEVIVAAFSTTQNPRMGLAKQFDPETGNPIFNDYSDLDTNSISIANGTARYAVPANSEGEMSWGGVIQVKDPQGNWKSYNIPKQSYTVAKPALVVSPTAMNVFYRGLENPVEVSVPGVPTEKLEIAISNANKSGSNGNFMVKPGSGSTCDVSVSAEINGKKQTFGKKEFRVKNVPDPKPYFSGKTGSTTIEMRELLAAPGVIAKMENFEFDLRFEIVSYTISATVKGKVAEQACQGPALTANAKTVIKELKSGQKLYIEKIKAKGPDGTVRDIGNISLTII
jgi:gliding motility-associated protein GldM